MAILYDGHGDIIEARTLNVNFLCLQVGGVNGDLVKTVVKILEVFRRFVWNFLRLENEHLNNCGGFRAVRDISIVPVNETDQGSGIIMMSTRIIV